MRLVTRKNCVDRNKKRRGRKGAVEIEAGGTFQVGIEGRQRTTSLDNQV